MTMLTGFLFAICKCLLIPVSLLLLLFLGWTAVLAGGFLREWMERGAVRDMLDQCLMAAKRGEDRDLLWRRTRVARRGILGAFRKRTAAGLDSPDVLIHTIAEVEHGITDSMAGLSLLTRVGPMLGLMGTLIPLGPALAGLAAGDLQAMAQNLVVAFTTTVIGVLIGSLAYGIGLVRRAWYARDLADLEYICQRLSDRQEPS